MGNANGGHVEHEESDKTCRLNMADEALSTISRSCQGMHRACPGTYRDVVGLRHCSSCLVPFAICIYTAGGRR